VEPAGGDEGSLADAIDAAATALLSGPDAVLIPHRGENQPLQEPERCGSPFLFDRRAVNSSGSPIESTFATVRHRTVRSKGCLSNKTALAMVFKLVEGAQKTWRRIDGHNQLPKLILGVKFTDGIEVIGTSAAPQAAA
jgi:hypothetical protein